MIKLENYEVIGWQHAVRGMRNPMNSLDNSDSDFKATAETKELTPGGKIKTQQVYYDALGIGENDHDLMMRLVKGGPVHAKFRRMITVYVDITAPLYWWKEFDTYKVGTVANSCSTMHKIHAKEFILSDFSYEHLFGVYDEDGNVNDLLLDVSPDCGGTVSFSPSGHMLNTIKMLNMCRDKFLKTRREQSCSITKFWLTSTNGVRTINSTSGLSYVNGLSSYLIQRLLLTKENKQ